MCLDNQLRQGRSVPDQPAYGVSRPSAAAPVLATARTVVGPWLDSVRLRLTESLFSTGEVSYPDTSLRGLAVPASPSM